MGNIHNYEPEVKNNARDEVDDDYEKVDTESVKSEVDMLLEDAEPQDHNPIDIFNKYK